MVLQRSIDSLFSLVKVNPGTAMNYWPLTQSLAPVKLAWYFPIILLKLKRNWNPHSDVVFIAALLPVKLENEVALVTSESKDLGMRHMRLDKVAICFISLRDDHQVKWNQIKSDLIKSNRTKINEIKSNKPHYFLSCVHFLLWERFLFFLSRFDIVTIGIFHFLNFHLGFSSSFHSIFHNQLNWINELFIFLRTWLP